MEHLKVDSKTITVKEVHEAMVVPNPKIPVAKDLYRSLFLEHLGNGSLHEALDEIHDVVKFFEWAAVHQDCGRVKIPS